MIVQETGRHYHERGATALIVVVFSILLIMTITVGFLRLIIQDQKRSTDDELSRGAYDAALAGVEDGKRVLQEAASGNIAAREAISAGMCNTIHAAKVLSASDSSTNTEEVKLTTGNISTDTAGKSFDQAYTCVKITSQTATYKNSLDRDKSDVVPLTATGDFSDLTISWHAPTADNAPVGGVRPEVTPSLPRLEDWSSYATGKDVRPALLRVQLIQFNENNVANNNDDLDKVEGGSTLFLYPSTTGAETISFSAYDSRNGGASLRPVVCRMGLIDATGYACRAKLSLPNPKDGTASDRLAYLRVTPLYNAQQTSFEISLGGDVKFDNVEPSIDSTGRAANVFRRVDARVKHTSTSFEYPRATVDVTNNLCKNFGVTGALYVPGAAPSCSID